MGAENAVFESHGEVRIGLTYMTGTLVKLGQRLTAAVLGGDSLGWMRLLPRGFSELAPDAGIQVDHYKRVSAS